MYPIQRQAMRRGTSVISATAPGGGVIQSGTHMNKIIWFMLRKGTVAGPKIAYCRDRRFGFFHHRLGNLIAQLALATEKRNRRWYQANTGRVVTDVQQWTLRWMVAANRPRCDARMAG